MSSLSYQHIATTSDDLTKVSVQWLEDKLKKAIDEKGFAIIGLSGGSTPGPIYEKLGESSVIDFSKVHVFLVDERYISAKDKDANTNLVTTTLLKNAKVPSGQFVHPNTELPIEECIKDYHNRVGELLKKGNPDVMTLGLGPDGHIASLFPPVNINQASDENVLTLHTTTTKFAVFDRITVTFPVIRKARDHVFFMKGKDKLEVWNEMLSQPGNHERWPGQKVIEDKRTTLIIAV